MTRLAGFVIAAVVVAVTPATAAVTGACHVSPIVADPNNIFLILQQGPLP